MQEIIKTLIKHVNNEGLDHDDIGIYLRGVFDGIKSFSDTLQKSKRKIEKNETDPLFIYTWNHVIDSLIKTMHGMVDKALEGIPENIGVEYDNEP